MTKKLLLCLAAMFWVKLVLADGGMVIGGPLDGSIMPGSRGGMVIGGPLDGSIMPGSRGGMVIGGPLDGSTMPGSDGGMVIGGPLHGSIMPGFDDGNVVGEEIIPRTYARSRLHQVPPKRSHQKQPNWLGMAMVVMERKNGHIVTGTKEASELQRMLKGDFSSRNIVDSGPTKCIVKPVMSDEDIARCQDSRNDLNRLNNVARLTTTTESPLYFKLDDLFDAVWSSDIAKVELVLKQGLDVNQRNDAGDTPLIVAIKINNLGMARILIKNGAKPNMTSSAGYSPLIYAKTDRTPNAELINFLIESGISKNSLTQSNSNYQFR